MQNVRAYRFVCLAETGLFKLSKPRIQDRWLGSFCYSLAKLAVQHGLIFAGAIRLLPRQHSAAE